MSVSLGTQRLVEETQIPATKPNRFVILSSSLSSKSISESNVAPVNTAMSSKDSRACFPDTFTAQTGKTLSI
ncbi:Uncharacterised protein [Chlamydia trachomatis]|nr:Uncharacterised protein [Chlamydia trachomatis]CRH48651.1 Uncharacterised protein [Chlamydia trachomatis]